MLCSLKYNHFFKRKPSTGYLSFHGSLFSDSGKKKKNVAELICCRTLFSERSGAKVIFESDFFFYSVRFFCMFLLVPVSFTLTKKA